MCMICGRGNVIFIGSTCSFCVREHTQVSCQDIRFLFCSFQILSGWYEQQKCENVCVLSNCLDSIGHFDAQQFWNLSGKILLDAGHSKPFINEYNSIFVQLTIAASIFATIDAVSYLKITLPPGYSCLGVLQPRHIISGYYLQTVFIGYRPIRVLDG